MDVTQSIIGSITIDVMKFERNLLTVPLGSTTILTTAFFQPFIQQPLLQSPSILNFPFDKNLLNRACSIFVTLPTENRLSEKMRYIKSENLNVLGY